MGSLEDSSGPLQDLLIPPPFGGGRWGRLSGAEKQQRHEQEHEPQPPNEPGKCRRQEHDSGDRSRRRKSG